MGNFSEHIQQAKNNLEFLSNINEKIEKSWDWQVTTSFYVAVHLINSHIVDKTSKNYLSHNQVSDIINPFSQLSVAKLDQPTYISYTKLQSLSRRSRYLLNENFKKNGGAAIQPACITIDRHFKKSIVHLDNILEYIKANHQVQFKKHRISCPELRSVPLKNFIIN